MHLAANILSSPTLHRALRALTQWRHGGARPELDVAFVMPPSDTQGWILNAICRELAQRFDGLRTALVNVDSPLPRAQTYFFSHYAFFYRVLRGLTPARLGRSYVFATHLEPGKNRMSDTDVARLLALSDGVFCMNAALRDRLRACGTPARLLHVSVGAADRRLFVPHARRADGYVGFCAAYYARKAPEKLLEIVGAMPHRRFVLLGRDWPAWSRFDELRALSNFEYVEPKYADYPGWYARMSVFCSVSTLEGGPIPLVESMFCNVVPVASRTGFCPDLIRHGENGFLFDIDASSARTCELIDDAFALEADVSDIADACDWTPYARHMAGLMGLPVVRQPPGLAWK